jgi:D-mycarose 3-C-methyltransferase
VLDGMRNLVKTCEIKFGSLKDKKIIDIGCNDGSLLDFFHNAGALTFGVEPTGAADDAKTKDKHIIVNNFLSKEVASDLLKKYGTFDFITFTNVFAHIEDLKSLIEALKLIMSDDTVIIIENHYLGSVLDKNQFDTFYHEHPRTYSYQSFKYIANLLKVDLIHIEFPNRYGGNIRVFLGKKSINLLIDDGLEAIKKNEEHFYAHFINMQIDIEKWKSRKRKVLEEYVYNFGKIPAKAFPGRSAILIKLLNIDESLISAVYEKPGSLKIGHYVPGTRIPILSDDELFMQGNQKPILNLAWHISSEIKNYLKLHNYHGEVLDIINQSDFS